MLLEGNFEVNAPAQTVWEKITDPSLMARCIPGCESISEVNSTTYDAVVVVGIGIIKARFNLQVEIVSEDPPTEVRSRTSGQEGARASHINAENLVRLTRIDPQKTRVDYQSDVSISGRLGKFGLGVMRKYVEGVGDEFAENFRVAITGDKPAIKIQGSSDSKTTRMARALKMFGVGTNTSKVTASENENHAGEFASQDIREGLTATDPGNQTLRRPTSIQDAINILSDNPESLPLAGGATLIAMKNAGLVKVDTFVSLERIDTLRGITKTANGEVRIGAMTRHCDTADSSLLTGTLAVVRQAAQSIANVPVRNMGTIGGSVAHADPAADYLAALMCVDATVELMGPSGPRSVPISEFLVDWYETALEPGEIITAILLPAQQTGHSVYRKIARVSGDYAIASCAMSVALAQSAEPIRIAVGGCGPFPVRSTEAERALHVAGMSSDAVSTFANQLISLADPVDDVRGSAEYRRNLIPRLVREALAAVPQRGAV